MVACWFMRRGLPWLVAGVTGVGAASAETPSKPKFRNVSEFGPCADQRAADECIEALHEYVEGRPDQAFEAGKAVTMYVTHWAAIPFFEKGLSMKADPVRCKDARLELAVASALGQPRNTESGSVIAQAKTILGQRCWNELLPPITKRIAADKAGYLTRNACRVFAEKNHSASACLAKPSLPAAKAVDPGWEALDPKKIQVEGTVQVFKGEAGRRISLAKVKGKPYFLVKFEGFRGPWNGKVVLHREESASSGLDYWTPLNGRRYVSVVARRPSGSDAFSWEVYPSRGEGPFTLQLDPEASKSAKAEALRAEFAR
jgi:hypothetical protein